MLDDDDDEEDDEDDDDEMMMIFCGLGFKAITLWVRESAVMPCEEWRLN